MSMTCVIKIKHCAKNQRIIFLVFIMVVFVLTACRKKSENSAITVGALNGPSGLSLVKIMHENSLSVHKNAEDYIIKNDPELIKAMMIREDLDLALIPFTMAALLYNNNFPYQLVGVPVWGSLFLVGSDSSITSIEDLKGKTVHTLPRNMTPDIVFRQILSKSDIDPDTDLDLKYTFPTPIELASALEANRIQLGVVPEPMVSRILKRNPGLSVIFDFTQRWDEIYNQNPPLAQTALMVRKSWAKHNPDLLKKWCEKYSNAIKWTNTHTEEAGLLAVEYNIARDEGVVSRAIPRCRMNFKYGFEKKEELMNYLSLLYKINSKIVGNRIPDEDFFYSK
jgi:NitT/TauT family transport system substrate-binding protein